MIPIRAEAYWKGVSDCRSCGIRDMALFADLNEQDFGLIHAPIDDLHFSVHGVLFHEDEAAPGILTIRHGAVKLVRNTQDGRERVVRVLRPGDVAGLEAIATGRYGTEAVALSDTDVCRIPLAVIHRLDAESPRLHSRLMEKWQRALRDADDWLAELNYGTARQRVANFILKMRNPMDSGLVTLFAREDMGAMMDLTLETVSREISLWVKRGVISPLDRQGRGYRLNDEKALRQT